MSENGKNIPQVHIMNKTKMCHIIKCANFDGYGFNLHSEKAKPGQYIGKVDSDSPAEAAGLKEGDKIIEVNGVQIGNETHKQVVQRIKSIAFEVRLLLIENYDKNELDPLVIANSFGKSSASNGIVNVTENRNRDDDTKFHGSFQNMPGASTNISSISMQSTKLMENEQNNSMIDTNDESITNIVDKNVYKIDQYLTNTFDTMHTNASSPLSINSMSTSVPAVRINPKNNKDGSLHLPTTAAEMRAKLQAKKKLDPKNESVDFKKKFDIIQKL